MKWNGFIKLFFDRHFPRTGQEKLAREFDKLEQDNIIIDKYSAKFNRLSHFFPSPDPHKGGQRREIQERAPSGDQVQVHD